VLPRVIFVVSGLKSLKEKFDDRGRSHTVLDGTIFVMMWLIVSLLLASTSKREVFLFLLSIMFLILSDTRCYGISMFLL